MLPILTPELDQQGKSLEAMTAESFALLNGRLMVPMSNIGYALASFVVKQRRFYSDKNSSYYLRAIEEPFYPFVIATQDSRPPVDGSFDPPAAVSIILMDTERNLHLIRRNVGLTVHRDAFVSDAGKIAPPPNFATPRDGMGRYLVLTEDVIHQIIGKTIDYNNALFTKLLEDRDEVRSKNPNKLPPNEPAPPLTIANVGEQLPPPEPTTVPPLEPLPTPPAPPGVMPVNLVEEQNRHAGTASSKEVSPWWGITAGLALIVAAGYGIIKLGEYDSRHRSVRY